MLSSITCQRIYALALGSAAAALIAVTAWPYVKPRSVAERMLQANEYNNAVAGMYLPGPHKGPPVLLKANFRLHDWIVTNSLGLRAPEPSPAKARKRILVLGDSFTFGYGLTEKETFCQALNRRLGSEAEVYNAGVSGFEIQDSVAQYFRIVDQIRPDAVVVTFVSNDLNDSYVSDPNGLLQPPRIGQLADGMFASSANLLRIAAAAGLDSQALPAFLSKNHTGDEFFLMGLGPFARSRWDRYVNELGRLVADAHRRGAKVLPFSFDPPRACRVQRWARACAKLGLPAYCLDSSIDLSKPEYHLTWDPHPNGAANEAIADSVMGALVNECVVKPVGRKTVNPMTVPGEDAVTLECFSTARYRLAPGVNLMEGTHVNLMQILGGFEDTRGLLGARAVVMLGTDKRLTNLYVTARLAEFQVRGGVAPDDRRISIRVGNGEARTFEVGPESRVFTLALTPADFESVADVPFEVCEVELRDPVVDTCAPQERRRSLGIRVEQVVLY